MSVVYIKEIFVFFIIRLSLIAKLLDSLYRIHRQVNSPYRLIERSLTGTTRVRNNILVWLRLHTSPASAQSLLICTIIHLTRHNVLHWQFQPLGELRITCFHVLRGQTPRWKRLKKTNCIFLFYLFSLVSTRHFDISYVKKIRMEKGVSFNTKRLKLNLVTKLIIMPGYFVVKG